MARVIAISMLAVLAAAASAAQQDDQFRKAGVCSRCHVISVVEWGMSRHSRAGTGCVACHGESKGHVVDERNNIKPERMPHGEQIASLCAGCHTEGCPHSKHKAGCTQCHHVHALLNPSKPPAARDEGFENRVARQGRYSQRMEEGERARQAKDWRAARTAFTAALGEVPHDRRATAALAACERRLAGALPGFEILDGAYDDASGLPRQVRVSGLGIEMVLVPRGEFEMGSEAFPNAKPVHTVSVEPFYLARFEMTQAEWKQLMGSNPSAHPGDRLPVDSVSWQDAQALVRKLNEQVPGGGFRLPTEAEWEYTARAGNSPAVPLSESAWFGLDDTKSTQTVGTKKPNRFGLFDLCGNVWEWTSSLNQPYPYVATDGREAPAADGMRILRGGGYADSARLLDPAMRHSERTDRRLRSNGLRIARSVPAP